MPSKIDPQDTINNLLESVLLKSLEEEPVLEKRLEIIRGWCESIDNKEPITIEHSLRQEIVNLILEPDAKQESSDEKIRIRRLLHSKLSTAPSFLSTYNYCRKNHINFAQEDFWETIIDKPIANNESEEAVTFKSKIDRSIFEQLSHSLNIIPPEYQLTEPHYLEIVKNGRKQSIIWFNSEPKVLTSDAYIFLVKEIIKTHALNSDKPEESNKTPVESHDSNYINIADKIISLLPPCEEKNKLALSISLNLFKNTEQDQKLEALRLLEKLGTNRQVMYWLLLHYFKERKSAVKRSDLEVLEDLIILFHHESGVNLNDCYGMVEKVKKKGSFKIRYSLLSFEQLKNELTTVFTILKLFTLFTVIASVTTLVPGIIIPLIVPITAGLATFIGSYLAIMAICLLVPIPITLMFVPLAKFFNYRFLKEEAGAKSEIAVSNVSGLAEALSPLKNFASSWMNIFSAYKNKQQFADDLLMPVNAIGHILFGFMGIGSAFRHTFHEGFKAAGLNLLYSVNRIIEGLLELATTLPVYAIKMPLRTIASVFSLCLPDKPQAPKMAIEALLQLDNYKKKEPLLIDDVNHKILTMGQKIHQAAKLEKKPGNYYGKKIELEKTPEQLKWRELRNLTLFSSNSEQIIEECRGYLTSVSNTK